MEKIICKSQVKKYECVVMIILAFFCTAAWCGRSVYWRLVWILPGAILADILAQCGEMVLDAQGIHAVVPLKGEVAQIPWKAICKCKLYNGSWDNPSVCVMYQNPFTIKFCKELNQAAGFISLTDYGAKVVCDRDLAKLFFGLEKPEKFIQREVFGCAMNQEEYSQVLKWWIAAKQSVQHGSDTEKDEVPLGK